MIDHIIYCPQHPFNIFIVPRSAIRAFQTSMYFFLYPIPFHPYVPDHHPGLEYLILGQPQPASNVPAYHVALDRRFGLASVRLESLLQHACVEEAI
jgi:hypothetical protein